MAAASTCGQRFHVGVAWRRGYSSCHPSPRTAVRRDGGPRGPGQRGNQLGSPRSGLVRAELSHAGRVTQCQRLYVVTPNTPHGLGGPRSLYCCVAALSRCRYGRPARVCRACLLKEEITVPGQLSAHAHHDRVPGARATQGLARKRELPVPGTSPGRARPWQVC